jgi:signal transduction histidine kinase
VDVVGFPELSSGPPVLREAVARKTGHAALPAPRPLAPEDLAHADLDSTRVRIKAVLVNGRNTPSGHVLEMHVGLRSFLALLPGSSAAVASIPEGSQLELTGTYASQSIGPGVASFGLLLDSPADVAVLARPPWWTFQRLFYVLGALACILAMTLLWITQLRHKVGQRTAELEIQIRERQRVEQQRVMEQERARIAQDLHDELGSGLTEISMLGSRARSGTTAAEARVNHLDQLGSKAREMVIALDEIVWAMNPTHDSLDSMISYFSLYAERFLGLAGVAWRLERPFVAEDCQVDSQRRHQLFLAFKEALNNVVRHSRATEVIVNFQVQTGRIRLRVSDNGLGWSEADRTQEMDGVANMRTRLENLGGHFELQSKAGEGMAVSFDLPLNGKV